MKKLICRTATQMPESAKEKISMFCHVSKEQVICLPDVKNTLEVPIILDDHNLASWFVDRLSLGEILNETLISNSNQLIYKNSYMQKWRDLAEKFAILLFFLPLLFKICEFIFLTKKSKIN